MHVFGSDVPDVLVADSYFPYDPRGFKYEGFDRVPCSKGFILGDYWEVTGAERDRFVNYVISSKSDFVISLFPQPLTIFSESPISKKLFYLPPCFDPAIFRDWRVPKTFDIGFLAAGTVEPSPTYPERARIHERLLKKGLKYLYAAHPGWGKSAARHPLVGSGFSRAINSCRMFVTTAGSLRNANAKYIEILASRSLLLADEPLGADRLGLEDGLNYVKLTEENMDDKIAYFLRHPEEAEAIATRGYELALKHHTCYTRAVEFFEAMRPKLDERERLAGGFGE